MNQFYLDYLKSIYLNRKSKNLNYSLRAFARDLEIHPSTLSAILKNKRGIPFIRCTKICDKLQIYGKKRDRFIKSMLFRKNNFSEKTLRFSNPPPKITLHELKFAKIISNWEYFAILSLFETKNFKGSIQEISKKLGLTPSRTELLLSHLTACNFIDIKDGLLVRTKNQNFNTSEDLMSSSLKEAHRQELQLALKKLHNIPLTKRDYSSNYMAINTSKIPLAKKYIREFRIKMESILEQGSRDEVYLLGIQLFPITELALT